MKKIVAFLSLIIVFIPIMPTKLTEQLIEWCKLKDENELKPLPETWLTDELVQAIATKHATQDSGYKGPFAGSTPLEIVMEMFEEWNIKYDIYGSRTQFLLSILGPLLSKGDPFSDDQGVCKKQQEKVMLILCQTGCGACDEQAAAIVDAFIKKYKFDINNYTNEKSEKTVKNTIFNFLTNFRANKGYRNPAILKVLLNKLDNAALNEVNIGQGWGLAFSLLDPVGAGMKYNKTELQTLPSFTLDDVIAKLIKKGKITKETAERVYVVGEDSYTLLSLAFRNKSAAIVTACRGIGMQVDETLAEAYRVTLETYHDPEALEKRDKFVQDLPDDLVLKAQQKLEEISNAQNDSSRSEDSKKFSSTQRAGMFLLASIVIGCSIAYMVKKSKENSQKDSSE